MASSMYKIWRIKLQDYPEGETDVNFYCVRSYDQSTMYAGEKTVSVRKNTCNNPSKYIYLKFLDKDGKYKFIQFDRFFTSETQQEQIGTVKKLSTSFATSQGSQHSIGYKQKKYINTSVQLKNDEYRTAYNVFFSPRVYMQINETTDLNDTDENWLLVTVDNMGGGFNSKRNAQTLSVKIELPDMFTIKM